MTWRPVPRLCCPARLLLLALAVVVPIAIPGSLSRRRPVDFGDISHKGLKDLGPASTGLKLSLELGMIANQQGIANAVKAASNPSSSSYGKYLSLSTLQKKYGASSSRRNAVVGAFKPYGVTATVDVTHLRVERDDQHRERAEAVRHASGTCTPTGRAEPGRRASGQHAEAGVGPERQRRHGRRASGSTSPQHASASASVSPRTRRGRLRSRAGRRRAPGRSTRAARRTHVPGGRALDGRPVPEPDPHRVRDRPAAGRRPAGPGHARRDPRRGADTGQRRHRVPQLLRLPRDGADRSTAARASRRSSRARSTR